MRLTIRERLEANRRSEINNSVAVAKTLETPMQKYPFANIQSERRPSARGVSCSDEINFAENWKDHGQEVPTGSRRRTICERAREERSNFETLLESMGPEQEHI